MNSVGKRAVAYRAVKQVCSWCGQAIRLHMKQTLTALQDGCGLAAGGGVTWLQLQVCKSLPSSVQLHKLSAQLTFLYLNRQWMCFAQPIRRPGHVPEGH